MTDELRPPLIIIGAARSGTNALRDALVSLPGMHTWPCDEINYIWRSGNRAHPTDELQPRHATPDVVSFIRGRFMARATKHPDRVLVEKTCANTLRLSFVDAVVPQARFVVIERDGRDVVSSAMSRWRASLDLAYVVRKARFVPPRDLPYYASRYLRARAARSANDGRLSTWGPRFAGLDELVAGGVPLDEVCARQWAASVAATRAALTGIPSGRVLRIEYADLVDDPHGSIAAIAEFSGQPATQPAIAQAAATIHGGSLGAWKSRLSADELARVEPIVAELAESHGP